MLFKHTIKTRRLPRLKLIDVNGGSMEKPSAFLFQNKQSFSCAFFFLEFYFRDSFHQDYSYIIIWSMTVELLDPIDPTNALEVDR
ncbi:MAG: hypothetical protein UY41_C0009G0024 [Candidatus Moranbacteria bacterium GW2011_GWE1_49_15]|nr:MAG: hypothetical protein UX75_C0002G0026 [Candidatus Moranbacteria bacterium GW2011_GWE2_47_10]KKW07085.1 MAG: hypothetical protein UY41_C0009G0024 [Candidatus Moranbacteria bacterium GW2011_GWE1_49_15]